MNRPQSGERRTYGSPLAICIPPLHNPHGVVEAAQEDRAVLDQVAEDSPRDDLVRVDVEFFVVGDIVGC